MKIMREVLHKTAPKEDMDTAQVESERELSEAFRAFRERSNAESRRRLEATDSEFWFAVCFETRAQKEEFLKKLGLMLYGDKYLDGRAVALRMGIDLENKGTLPPLKIKRDKDFEALSLNRKEVI